MNRSRVNKSRQFTELGSDNRKAISLKPHITSPKGNTPRINKSTSKGTTKIDVIRSPTLMLTIRILGTVKRRPFGDEIIVKVRIELKTTAVTIMFMRNIPIAVF